MDIKVEIKEEPCFVDICSQNEREICCKELKTIMNQNVISGYNCDIDIKTKVEEEAEVSNFSLENSREFVSENCIKNYNNVSKDGEFKPKIEIKEEQCWEETNSTENLCIYDDIKHGIDDLYSTTLPTSYREGVSTCTPGLFSNEDLRNCINHSMGKNSLECGSSRKYQSEEGKVADISSTEKSFSSETFDSGIVLNNGSFLKPDNSLQQNNTNKQSTNKQKCKSFLSSNNRKLYKCDICDKAFTKPDLSGLKRHKLIHQGIKPYKCSICNKAFTDLQHLKRHKLIHEDTKPYKCDICDKAFTDMTRLKNHKLIHEDIKPYNCDVCDKGFSNLSNFKNHKFIHEGIKPYKCSICNKDFTQLQHLKRHKLIHENVKPYKCNICEKAFTDVSCLKRHKLIHEGIKPYKCDICDKTFTHLQHLKRHKLIHEDIKPYKCDICDKGFTDLSSFKRHKLIHEGTMLHKCDICDKSFTRLQHLKKHKLIHK